jgi:hypothetical protein
LWELGSKATRSQPMNTSNTNTVLCFQGRAFRSLCWDGLYLRFWIREMAFLKMTQVEPCPRSHLLNVLLHSLMMVYCLYEQGTVITGKIWILTHLRKDGDGLQIELALCYLFRCTRDNTASIINLYSELVIQRMFSILSLSSGESPGDAEIKPRNTAVTTSHVFTRETRKGPLFHVLFVL